MPFNSKTRVEQLEAENRALRRQVEDRSRNALQLVYSLLDLEGCPYGHRQQCGTIVGCRERILAVSLVHEALVGHEAGVELGSFLQRLLGSLVLGSDIPGHVHYDLEVEPATVTAERSVPLGLLVCEVATEALAFAADRNEREVRIRLRTGSDGFVLSVSPFRPTDELEPTRAQVLRALSSQLGCPWPDTPGELLLTIPTPGEQP